AFEDPPSINATWHFSAISFTLFLTSLPCSITRLIALSRSSAVTVSIAPSNKSPLINLRISTANPSSSTISNAFTFCSA
ncbi:hypothetical protein N665_3050s0004, partial [Sinapis alba]